MAERYSKTDTGRAEIRARVHALTRTARNLLLIIDPSKEAADWMSLVQGATDADLRTLVDAGLVAPFGSASAPVRPAAGAPAVEGSDAAPADAVPPLSYSDLYDLLPSLAKQHLGLMKGYRFVLAIERAEGLAGLQKVAQELVAEVESSKGPAVARSVRRALLLP